MDNEQDRNEHFKGFADLVAQEIEQLEERVVPGTDLPISQGHWQEAIRDIIAQRAYDLTMHVLSTMDPLAFQATLSDDEIMKSIPDLTEWPNPPQP